MADCDYSNSTDSSPSSPDVMMRFAPQHPRLSYKHDYPSMLECPRGYSSEIVNVKQEPNDNNYNHSGKFNILLLPFAVDSVAQCACVIHRWYWASLGLRSFPESPKGPIFMYQCQSLVIKRYTIVNKSTVLRLIQTHSAVSSAICLYTVLLYRNIICSCACACACVSKYLFYWASTISAFCFTI